MKREFKYNVLLAIAAASLTCSCIKENTLDANTGDTFDINSIKYFTVTLEGDSEPSTKTSYAFSDGALKASWAAGDIIAITPDYGLYKHSALYEVVNPGASTGVFQQIRTMNTSYGGPYYGYAAFYPGDIVAGVTQYTQFSYSGQVQRKSNPMGHIGNYHTMWAKVSGSTTINFTNAHQSSCLRFNLKGMTFRNPTKIEIEVKDNKRFYLNNEMGEEMRYYYYESDPAMPLTFAKNLSMTLEGYGDEEFLEAWMMTSNATVELMAGDVIVVSVTDDNGRHSANINVKQDTELAGGRWHSVKVTKGWYDNDLEEPEIPEYDGEVVTLQEPGGNLDLIIMGDGFIAEDFEDGTYEKIMLQAYDEFFGVEPYTTLKDDFNVYYIKAVSEERTDAITTGANGARNNSYNTRFKVEFTPNSTRISGDNDLVREYAAKALPRDTYDRMRDVTIVVVANQECRSGTCWNMWYADNGKDYGQACSISYCALGTDPQERIDIMHHEICGHGFGKLADEYTASSSLSTTDPWYVLRDRHNLGLFRNVDVFVNQAYHDQLNDDVRFPLTTRENVLWSDMFNTVNNYESADVESLGVFEGANTYIYGFCRPTFDGTKSIMNYNSGIFNAISRRQIYYRYLRLSGKVTQNEFGTATELNRFLEWDREYMLPKILDQIAYLKANPGKRNFVEDIQPLAPPVYIEGEWDGIRFIPKEK